MHLRLLSRVLSRKTRSRRPFIGRSKILHVLLVLTTSRANPIQPLTSLALRIQAVFQTHAPLRLLLEKVIPCMVPRPAQVPTCLSSMKPPDIHCATA